MRLFQSGMEALLMIKAFEQVVHETIEGLRCSADEKHEIELELKDHLYSAYEFYVASGVKEEEAIQLALVDFGFADDIRGQYQKVVRPLYGWLEKTAWIGFVMYCLTVLWEIVISRLFVRIFEYVQADGPHQLHYVYSSPWTWETKQFFDFSQWQSNVNFHPFEMILFYAAGNQVNSDIAFNNLAGNLMLLMPLGLLLPFLFYKCKSFVTVTAIAFCVSFLIELVQFSLQIGMADIDDVLLNTFGAMVGYWFALGIFTVLSWHERGQSFKELK